jgi:hypothetical protein
MKRVREEEEEEPRKRRRNLIVLDDSDDESLSVVWERIKRDREEEACRKRRRLNDDPPLLLEEERRYLSDDNEPLPPTTDNEAWRTPEVQRRAFRGLIKHSNRRNPYVGQERVRADHTLERHDYYLDGKIWNWSEAGVVSASWLLGGRVYKKFEEEDVADRIARGKTGGTDGRYLGLLQNAWQKLGHTDTKAPPPDLPEELVEEVKANVKAAWEKNRGDGSFKHTAYDSLLQDPDAPLPRKSLPPPPGFYKCVAWILQRYDIWGTEVTLYDETRKIIGQADLVLYDRETGEIVLSDWKNCRSEDLGDESKARGQLGCHPFTATFLDTKLNHYQFQLSLYREMIVRLCKNWPRVSRRMLLFNFDPDRPDDFDTYPLDPLDMAYFIDTYLPWNPDDPKHFTYRGGNLIPYFPDDDPRCQGSARRVHIMHGEWKNPLVKWVGYQSPSRTQTIEHNKAVALCRKRKAAAEKEMQIAEYQAAAAEEKKLCDEWAERKWRYTLKASPLRHPWRRGRDEPAPRGWDSFYEWNLLRHHHLLSELQSCVGKYVACWCDSPEKQCHADIVVKYANLLENGAWTLPPLPVSNAIVIEDDFL